MWKSSNMVRGFQKYGLLSCFPKIGILGRSRRRNNDTHSEAQPLKSILKKPTATNVQAIEPKKQVIINSEPEVKLIERVLINWRRFERRKQMGGVKTTKQLRILPLKVQCKKWIILAIINNIENPAVPATKRKARNQLRRPCKRQRLILEIPGTKRTTLPNLVKQETIAANHELTLSDLDMNV